MSPNSNRGGRDDDQEDVDRDRNDGREDDDGDRDDDHEGGVSVTS